MLRFRTYLLIVFFLVSGLYVIAWTHLVPVFVLYVIAAYILFLVTTFFYLGSLLLRFLPAPLREEHQTRPLRYLVSLLIPLIIFMLSSKASRYMAPYQQGILRILIHSGIWMFSAFVMWNLIKRTKRRVLVFGTVLFVIYFSVVTGWSSATSSAPKDTESSREALTALPYVSYASDSSPGKSGVTLHQKARASSGVNFYAPNHLAEAFLTDMHGKELHRWKSPKETEAWAHVALNPNGDLLAIYKDRKLTRLSWDSRVLWKQEGRFHHDARFGKNGDIYALLRKEQMVFHHFVPVPILNDFVVILSSDGQIKKEYSMFGLLKRYISPGKVFRVYRRMLQRRRAWRLVRAIVLQKDILFSQTSPFDLFHTNSVEPVESTGGTFGKENLLLSMRNISIVAVLNPESGEIFWESDQFVMQHQPSFLANGNILVFDNGLPSTGSRVAEIDPRTNRIVWEYKAQDFYAYNRGGTQRLPNGNVLITESPDGRVFEVTPNREIVWEFFTPQMKKGRRGVIYRLMRFSSAEEYPCLRPFLSAADSGMPMDRALTE